MDRKIFDRVGIRSLKVDRIDSTEIPELNGEFCPCCGNGPLDGATGASFDEVEQPAGPWDVVDINEEKLKPVVPQDGSPTICGYCGELLIFRKNDADKLKIVTPTEKDLSDWRSQPEFWRILTNLQEGFRGLPLNRNGNEFNEY